MPRSFAPDAGIEALWQSRSDHNGRYRVLPDGRCDIILRFADDADGPRAIVPILTGPSPVFHDIDLSPGLGFVGARFKPGHAPRFMDLSPQDIPYDGLRGTAALDRCPWLAILIALAPTKQALIARFRDVLAQKAAQNPPPPFRIRAIAGAFHASAGRLDVAEVARIHGLSARHLGREWRHLTGFAPKTYAMILQFQQALRLMQRSRLSAAAAAFEAGYADQAHMTRAFRRFGGFTPARIMDVTVVTLSGDV